MRWYAVLFVLACQAPGNDPTAPHDSHPDIGHGIKDSNMMNVSSSVSGDSADIIVNGMRIKVRNNSIFVNGKLYGPTDGGPVPVGEAPLPKELTLSRNGTIDGNIPGDLTVNVAEGASVTVTVNGSVQGSIKTGGDVYTTNVNGSVKAGGNVTAVNISGSVSAGGNVSR